MNEPERKDILTSKEKELLAKKAEIKRIKDALSSNYINESADPVISFLLKRL